WSMGKKITIDSATMANKGLEIIETKEFFAIDVSKIKVIIHPQSLVHSLIRTIDGSLYAQISKPNMDIPIQNALTYPELWHSHLGHLNLAGCSFNFYPVDERKYPLVNAAYQVVSAGKAYPIAFNAANETAVSAFIHNRITFLDISRVVLDTLQLDWSNPVTSFDEVLEIDRKVREAALNSVKKFKNNSHP
ncbi:MAG: 1-deoxy-D-xylulose-5-phosphate reductoisomerase, partial [Spirochaetota bacterium]